MMSPNPLQDLSVRQRESEIRTANEKIWMNTGGASGSQHRGGPRQTQHGMMRNDREQDILSQLFDGAGVTIADSHHQTMLEAKAHYGRKRGDAHHRGTGTTQQPIHGDEDERPPPLPSASTRFADDLRHGTATTKIAEEIRLNSELSLIVERNQARNTEYLENTSRIRRPEVVRGGGGATVVRGGGGATPLLSSKEEARAIAKAKFRISRGNSRVRSIVDEGIPQPRPGQKSLRSASSAAGGVHTPNSPVTKPTVLPFASLKAIEPLEATIWSKSVAHIQPVVPSKLGERGGAEREQ